MVEPLGLDHDPSMDNADWVSEVEHIKKDEKEKYEYEDVDNFKYEHQENDQFNEYNVNLFKEASISRNG